MQVRWGEEESAGAHVGLRSRSLPRTFRDGRVPTKRNKSVNVLQKETEAPDLHVSTFLTADVVLAMSSPRPKKTSSREGRADAERQGQTRTRRLAG